MCAAHRLARQRECLTGALNIRQATRSPRTGLHLLHNAYTIHLFGYPIYDQTSHATLLAPTHFPPMETAHWACID